MNVFAFKCECDRERIIDETAKKIEEVVNDHSKIPRSVDKIFAEVALSCNTTLNTVRFIWITACQGDRVLANLHTKFKDLVARKRSLPSTVTKMNKYEREAIIADCKRLLEEGKDVAEIYTHLVYKFDRAISCVRNVVRTTIKRHNRHGTTETRTEFLKRDSLGSFNVEETDPVEVLNKVCIQLEELKKVLNSVQVKIEKAELVEAFLRAFTIILSKKEENEISVLRQVVDKYRNVTKIAP